MEFSKRKRQLMMDDLSGAGLTHKNGMSIALAALMVASVLSEETVEAAAYAFNYSSVFSTGIPGLSAARFAYLNFPSGASGPFASESHLQRIGPDSASGSPFPLSNSFRFPNRRLPHCSGWRRVYGALDPCGPVMPAAKH